MTDGWTGSWYGSPTFAMAGSVPAAEASARFEDSTLSSVLHLTTGGDRLRLGFSNLYGRAPLVLGSVTVRAGTASATATFAGRPTVIVAAGATATSDAIALRTAPGESIVVAVHYPDPVPERLTVARFSAERNVLTPGKATAETGGGSFGSWTDATCFLVSVDVEDPDSLGTIVGIGDSLTIGGATSWPSSPDLGAARRWPALLARRLHAAGRRYGVVNAGIVGNRMLRDGDDGQLFDASMPIFGPRLLSRFDRDVLARPNVRYAVLSAGINDIGLASMTSYALTTVVDDLATAMIELTARAHHHGIPLYVTTLPPFERDESLPPAGFYRPEKNDLRLRVNQWIRTAGIVDGVIDFERALADPRSPNRILPDLDSGDQFHPNDAGERALADATDLELFA